MKEGLKALKLRDDFLEELLEKDKNHPKLKGVRPTDLNVYDVSTRYHEFKDTLKEYVKENPESLRVWLRSLAQPIYSETFFGEDINLMTCKTTIVKTDCVLDKEKNICNENIDKGCRPKYTNPEKTPLKEYARDVLGIALDDVAFSNAVKLALHPKVSTNDIRDILTYVYVDGRLIEEDKYFFTTFRGVRYIYIDSRFISNKSTVIVEGWRNYNNKDKNGKLKAHITTITEKHIDINLDDVGRNHFVADDYLTYIERDGDFVLEKKTLGREITPDGNTLKVTVPNEEDFGKRLLVVSRLNNHVLEVDEVNVDGEIELFHTIKDENNETIRIPMPIDNNMINKLNVFIRGFHLTPNVDYRVITDKENSVAPKIKFILPVPKGIGATIYVNNESDPSRNVGVFQSTLIERDNMDVGDLLNTVDYKERLTSKGFTYLKTNPRIPIDPNYLVVYVDNRRVPKEDIKVFGNRLIQLKNINSLTNIDIRTYIPETHYIDDIIQAFNDNPDILDRFLDLIPEEDLYETLHKIALKEKAVEIKDKRDVLHSIHVHLNKYTVLEGEQDTMEYKVFATFLDGTFKEITKNDGIDMEGILISDTFQALRVGDVNEFTVHYIYNGIRKSHTAKYKVIPRPDVEYEREIAHIKVQPKATYSMDTEGSNLVQNITLSYNDGTGITIHPNNLSDYLKPSKYTVEYDKEIQKMVLTVEGEGMKDVELVPVRYIVPLDLVSMDLIENEFTEQLYYEGKPYPIYFQDRLVNSYKDFRISVVANYGLKDEQGNFTVEYSDNVTDDALFVGKRISSSGGIVPLRNQEFVLENNQFTLPERLSISYSESGQFTRAQYDYVVKKGKFTTNLKLGEHGVKRAIVPIDNFQLVEASSSLYSDYLSIDIRPEHVIGFKAEGEIKQPKVTSGFIKYNGQLFPIINVDREGNPYSLDAIDNTATMLDEMVRLIKNLKESKQLRDKYGESANCSITELEVLFWEGIRSDLVSATQLNDDLSITINDLISDRTSVLFYNGVFTPFVIDPTFDDTTIPGKKLSKVRLRTVDMNRFQPGDVHNLRFIRYQGVDEDSDNYLTVQFDKGVINEYIPGEVLFAQDISGAVITYNGIGHGYVDLGDEDEYYEGMIQYTSPDLVNSVHFNNTNSSIAFVLTHGVSKFGVYTEGRKEFINNRIKESYREVKTNGRDIIEVKEDGQILFRLGSSNIIPNTVNVFINGVLYPKFVSKNTLKTVNWYLTSGEYVNGESNDLFLSFNPEEFDGKLTKGDNILVIYDYLGVVTQ